MVSLGRVSVGQVPELEGLPLSVHWHYGARVTLPQPPSQLARWLLFKEIQREDAHRHHPPSTEQKICPEISSSLSPISLGFPWHGAIRSIRFDKCFEIHG